MVQILPFVYKDHARVLNMFLLIGVVACMTANMIVRRPRTIRRTRRIGLWLFLFLLNAVYGYSISIREHRSYNTSVGIATLILVGALAAFIWHPEGDNNPPPDDGSAFSVFMYWLDNLVRTRRTRHQQIGVVMYPKEEESPEPTEEPTEYAPEPNYPGSQDPTAESGEADQTWGGNDA